MSQLSNCHQVSDKIAALIQRVISDSLDREELVRFLETQGAALPELANLQLTNWLSLRLVDYTKAHYFLDKAKVPWQIEGEIISLQKRIELFGRNQDERK